ncbi:MAG: ABC transporter permease [Microbacteriaceae bacterium]|nr:ABC transporter permease [Microbacteriaceae bacterium]
MNLIVDAIAWILDPAHYGGPNGIGVRLIEHLWISVVSLVIAGAIAIPAGFLIGHTGTGRAAAVLVSGGVRALPTLGLISILGLSIGIGVQAPIIAFVVLAIPSMLAGAYAGFEAIDRRIVDSARSVGMTEWQIVGRVELPLGLPLLIGGIRSATLQVIATATLAAYISGGGLGSFIFLGLRTNDYTQMLAGSILVIALAIAFEGAFSALQRLVVPAGVRAGQRTKVRSGSPRSAAEAE